MSTHEASIRWSRSTEEHSYAEYNREHEVAFPGGLTITASAAPEYRGKREYPNPEEALVFAIASCHMLTFLAVCAKRKLAPLSYEDHAVGVLEKNQEGRLAVTRVTLRPRISFSGEEPRAELLAQLHEESHRGCFIAQSVKTRIELE